MEKVQKFSNSECYTPSSKHFRIHLKLHVVTSDAQKWSINSIIHCKPHLIVTTTPENFVLEVALD
jgi:hypothetical protein